MIELRFIMREQKKFLQYRRVYQYWFSSPVYCDWEDVPLWDSNEIEPWAEYDELHGS